MPKDKQVPEENGIDDELNALAEFSETEISAITIYPSLFDIVDMKQIIPEFYSGRDLVGYVIAIHSYDWKESREFGEFVIAKVQLPSNDDLVDVAFASIPTKQIFRGLDNVSVKFPFVVAVVQANATYTFEDANKFLSRFA